jgi:hypothetical protein
MGAFSSLTSNGVAYVNGSGQPTSGSSLTFDGTTLNISSALGTSTAALTLKNSTSASSSNIVEQQFFAGNSFSGLDTIAKFGALNPSAGANNYGAFYWSLANGGSPSEQMRLNSTGLGIGTSSPASKLDVSSSGEIARFRTSTARGSGNGYFGIYDATGRKGYYGYGGSDDSLYIANEMNAPMLFITNSTERARIDSSGNMIVGDTSTSSFFDGKLNVAGRLHAKLDNGANPVGFFWNTNTSANNGFVGFYTEATATIRGSITYNRAGGLTVFNTTSDYRAKDINGPVTNSGALIDSVPVYMGKMKWATEERPMFIAHETPSYAHTGEKDAVDADGNPVYQQMDASALIPVMWAEIQSLRKRLADAGIA